MTVNRRRMHTAATIEEWRLPDGNDAYSPRRQSRLADRTIDPSSRRPRQGHRPGRIYPSHAAAGHAACQAVPQHGRINSVDTSAARQLPGVLHVVTIDDIKQVIPDPYYGPAFHDQPILADGR